jgi:hypothetical protein
MSRGESKATMSNQRLIDAKAMLARVEAKAKRLRQAIFAFEADQGLIIGQDSELLGNKSLLGKALVYMKSCHTSERRGSSKSFLVMPTSRSNRPSWLSTPLIRDARMSGSIAERRSGFSAGCGHVLFYPLSRLGRFRPLTCDLPGSDVNAIPGIG